MQEVLKSILPDQLDPFAPLISGLAMGLLIFVVGWIISKWVHALALKLMRSRGIDGALSVFLASMAQWTVLAVVAICRRWSTTPESRSTRP